MFQGFREDEGACNMRREENVQHVNEVGYSVDIFGSPNGNIVDSIPAYLYNTTIKTSPSRSTARRQGIRVEVTCVRSAK